MWLLGSSRFFIPPTPIIAGVFSGLVYGYQPGNGTEADNIAAFFESTGFLSLTTKANGTFTGSLRLEGKTLTFKKTVFDGAASVTLKRTGKPDAVVALNFDSTARGKITGTVTANGITMPFQALPGISKTSIQTLAGKRYTIILPAPDATLGNGYATLVVTTKGTGTLAGKLADGTAFTTTSQIEDDPTDASNWLLPVYIPLYTASGGMLLGEVLLPKSEPADAADVIGTLDWLRPRNDKAKMFPSGFLKSLDVLGERYLLTKGLSLLTGTAATGNFALTVDSSGTVLASPVQQPGTWPKTNIPLLTKPLTAAMKLTFTGTTGLFKGTFSRTINGKAVSTPYEGAVLAHPLPLTPETSPVRAAGFFSTGTASGEVEMK